MLLIITVFLLLMGLYFNSDSFFVFYTHLLYCIFLIFYIIYGMQVKYKLLTILFSILVSSTVVYNAGSISRYVYLEIYKPKEEISLFLKNKEYENNNNKYKYKYGIREGLSYKDFQNYKYIDTMYQETHVTPYFTTAYNVIYKDGKDDIYIVKWRKLENNRTYLYFNKR